MSTLTQRVKASLVVAYLNVQKWVLRTKGAMSDGHYQNEKPLRRGRNQETNPTDAQCRGGHSTTKTRLVLYPTIQTVVPTKHKTTNRQINRCHYFNVHL